MGEFIDANGNTVNAYTEEEVNQKIEDAKLTLEEEHKTQIQEKEIAIVDLNTKLVELNKKILGATDKDKNWDALRTSKEELEKKVGTLEGELSGIKGLISDATLSQSIDKLSGGDAELSKLIKFHYKRFALDSEELKDPKKAEEGFQKRLNDAYTLAIGGGANPLTGKVVSSSGGGALKFKEGTQAEKLSPGADEVGRKMGLDDEDMKKHNLI